jgi:predicted component of type VI protein secretion system
VNGQLIGQREHFGTSAPTPDGSAPPHELQDGDEIQVGDAVFHVRISTTEEASIPAIPRRHV